MKTRGIVAAGLVLAGGLGTSAFFVHRMAKSADHLDSPATRADATMDINDVYTWMDGNNVAIAVTLFPVASAQTLFSTSAQYVIHTSSGAFGALTKDVDIICQFTGSAAPQTATCWVGTAGGTVASDYVTGNASAATGITSADSKFKVFAGPRSDPFFFNLDGFKATVGAVEAAAGSDAGLTFNDAGCPQLNAATSNALAGILSHNPVDGGAANDFFAPLNGLAIVISIDKTLLTTGGGTLAVWAATLK